MVNSICLAISIKILCDYHSTLLIQLVCECTQSSLDTHKLSVRLGRLSNQKLVLIKLTLVDCPSKSFHLTCSWSEHLFPIHQFGNLNSFGYLSIKLFGCSMIWCLTFFLPLIGYRYSHQVLCGPPDPLMGYYPTVSFTFNFREFFPWYMMPLVNCVFSLW